MSAGRGQLAVGLLALAWVGSLAGCSPCRDLCTEYTESLAAFTDPYATVAPGGLDHLVVTLDAEALEQLAAGAALALQERLRQALPAEIEVPLVGWRIRTGVSVAPTAFAVSPHPNGVGVELGLALDVSLVLPRELGGASSGLSGEVRLATVALVTDTTTPALVLRLSESRLDHLRLTPHGLGPLGAFGREVSGLVERAAREVFQPAVLGQLGDFALAELRPWRVEGATVRLAVNRLAVEGDRIVIGLRTDLVAAGPLGPPPLPQPAVGAVAVGVSPDLLGPLLGSVLAADGGRRFGDGAEADDDGPYGVVLTSLAPFANGVAFGYRLYRLAVPCLIADFSGEAEVAWVGDGPGLSVRRHELVYASRFESAVRDAQPPIAGLSERLTRLLGQALTTRVLEVGPGLGVQLEPVSLAVSEAGFEVGWRLLVR